VEGKRGTSRNTCVNFNIHQLKEKAQGHIADYFGEPDYFGDSD